MACVLAQIANSQSWQLTGSGTNDWLSIASSANGQILIADQWPGDVAVSTNGGLTWTNVLTNGYWNSVASSADGTKLLAATGSVDSSHISGIFLSTNSGASWISNNLPIFYWGPVAMSADGSTMVAGAPFGPGGFPPSGAIFCSTNSGASWYSNNMETATGSSTTPAVSVAMSADGRKIFVTGPIQLCCSTNFGTSWMQMTSAPPSYSFISPAQYIASSADGNKLIYSVAPIDNFNLIYFSTNSGNTWSLASLPGSYWTYVASSADGQTLMAASGAEVAIASTPGPLFISTNSGASWTTNTSENWAGAACSADGGALFAVAASDTNLDGNSGAVYKSQSIQRPLLNVAPVGSESLLSWLISSTDFVPEQSADLIRWTSMTNTPALNPANLQEQIPISPTNRAGFYRLVSGPNH